MKLITKDTDYAIRALVRLGVNKKKLLSAREIALKEKIPFAFLRRILQRLAKANMIESKEGNSGGIKLKKIASDIKIIDVIKVLQGNFELIDCLFRKKICHRRGSCPLRKRIKGIEKKVAAELLNISIEDLIKDLKR